MRSNRERLLDINEAIARIVRQTTGGRAEFDADELIQTWVVHHLQIIGEACRALSAEFKDRHPEVPWDKIVGMRHILVHRYFGIDRERVWGVVGTDLPILKEQVELFLKDQPTD